MASRGHFIRPLTAITPVASPPLYRDGVNETLRPTKTLVTLSPLFLQPSSLSLSPLDTHSTVIAIVLFRATDLRLHDHAPFAVAHGWQRALDQLPSYALSSSTPLPPPFHRLQSASRSSYPYRRITHVLPVHVIDSRVYGLSSLSSFGFPRIGPIRAAYSLEAIEELRRSLQERGSDLYIKLGKPEEVVPLIAQELYARHGKEKTSIVVLTHDEFAWEEQQVHAELEMRLRRLQILILTFWGSTLIHLSDLPFPITHLPNVFTSFRLQVEKCWRVRPLIDFTVPLSHPLKPLPPNLFFEPVPNMRQLGYTPDYNPSDPSPRERNAQVEHWKPHIDTRAVMAFKGGEHEAKKRVHEYIWETKALQYYKERRNGLIGADYSTKASPFLSTGSMSPLLLYHELKHFEDTVVKNDSTYWVIFEFLWRDYFRFYTLHSGRKMFMPYGIKGKTKVLTDKGLIQPEWNDDPVKMSAWINGRTGYPFVDANMIELKRTGWMSNRGRQVTASFLIKDLKMDWRIGAEWLESQLIDHEVGANWGNWGYISGVGGDPRSARYFSVPKQQEMYDPDQKFIHLWIPSLQRGMHQATLDQSFAGLKEETKHSSKTQWAALILQDTSDEVYNFRPTCPLFLAAKTDEKGNFLLNRKQKRDGIGVGGFDSESYIKGTHHNNNSNNRNSTSSSDSNNGPSAKQNTSGYSNSSAQSASNSWRCQSGIQSDTARGNQDGRQQRVDHFTISYRS